MPRGKRKKKEIVPRIRLSEVARIEEERRIPVNPILQKRSKLISLVTEHHETYRDSKVSDPRRVHEQTLGCDEGRLDRLILSYRRACMVEVEEKNGMSHADARKMVHQLIN